jgi:hypothetical protein
MNTELIEQNVHRLLGAMTGAATTAMVAVGDQLGLYRALADGGPATQDELARKLGACLAGRGPGTVEYEIALVPAEYSLD